jgi:hypothetical protein
VGIAALNAVLAVQGLRKVSASELVGVEVVA